MAGSYKHIVNKDGEFIGSRLLDNLGDAHEALEECFGMIHVLASYMTPLPQVRRALIIAAQGEYKKGLELGGTEFVDE